MQDAEENVGIGEDEISGDRNSERCGADLCEAPQRLIPVDAMTRRERETDARESDEGRRNGVAEGVKARVCFKRLRREAEERQVPADMKDEHRQQRDPARRIYGG